MFAHMTHSWPWRNAFMKATWLTLNVTWLVVNVTWPTAVTHMSGVRESRFVSHHSCISHVTPINESRRINAWDMSHHVTLMGGECACVCVCVGARACLWLYVRACVCVYVCVYVRAFEHVRGVWVRAWYICWRVICMWRDSFRYVTWLIQTWDITYICTTYTQRVMAGFVLVCLCRSDWACVWCMYCWSAMCATRLIHLCDMTF